VSFLGGQPVSLPYDIPQFKAMVAPTSAAETHKDLAVIEKELETSTLPSISASAVTIVEFSLALTEVTMLFG